MILIWLILMALIVPLIRVEPLQDPVVLPKLAATLTFAGLGLIAAAIDLTRGRAQLPRWPLPVWLAVAVFVVVNVAACANALDWRWSLFGEYQRYQGLGTTLLYVLLFLLAAIAIRSTRDLRWLLLAVFAAGVATSTHALIQKAGLDPFEDHFSRLDRPSSTVGQANAFAAYLIAVISVTVFLALSARERWQQALFAAGEVLMLFALYFTLSRSGFVALFAVLVIGAAAFALWYRYYRAGAIPRTRDIAVTAVLAAVAAITVIVLGAALFVRAGTGGAGAGRFENASAQDESVGGRISLWRMAVRMTADEPVLGSGQDSFTVLFPQYRDRPDYSGIETRSIQPESAHNFFLDLAAGTGVLGLLSFVAFAGCVMWYSLQRALSQPDNELRLGIVTVGAGAIGYLVAIFFGFSEAMTTWLFWLLLGTLGGLIAERSVNDTESIFSRLPAIGVFAVCGAVALGWAATLVAADFSAERADKALARGDTAAAVRYIDRAVSLNPLQKTYLEQQPQIYRNAAPPTTGRAEALEEAIGINDAVLHRFHPAAIDLINLAMTQLELARLQGDSPDDAYDTLEQGIQLDPYNVLFQRFAADFYRQQGREDLAVLHETVIYCWSQPCD